MENFRKMLLLFLYWVAVQDKSRTFRRQKPGFFHSKFSVNRNDINPSFWKEQEMA